MHVPIDQKLMASSSPACCKCSRAVDLGDCWIARKALEGDHLAYAAFCRLEHVVPWVMRGARWPQYVVGGMMIGGGAPDRCAFCDRALDHLGADTIDLARPHAGGNEWRAFCGAEHLRAWASAGGPWARSQST